jgi:hypothetical protein
MQRLRIGAVCLLMVAGPLVIAPALSGQQLSAAQRLSNLVDPLREEIGHDAFSLRGIESMGVVVEGLRDAAEVIGLTERQLRTDVELKLRTAGGKLDDSAAHYYLYLNVMLIHSPEIELVAYSIGLDFSQSGTFRGGFEGVGTT